MRIHHSTVLLATVLCGLATASAGIIALDGGTMAVMAQQGDPPAFQYALAPQGPTYPQSQTASATAGASWGTATYTIDSNLITLTTSFHRDGSYVNDNQLSVVSAFGSLNFTVDADSHYELTGQHALTGDQRVSMQVILDNLTTGVRLFRHYQYSEYTPDEVLNLGQPDGEFSELTGDAIGPLVAGHQYALNFSYQIVNPLGADAGADSIGNLHVILLPEPGTALLLLALGTLGVLRRR